MSDRFHNPYHFVPADHEATHAAGDLTAKEYRRDKDLGPKLANRSHDRYCDNTFSGRIVCKLTTKAPLIVGGKRSVETRDGKPADYTLIEPYRLGGQIAIPATSLKGVVSTIAEAASFSALRVLNDQAPISYRQEASASPSAMGVLERNDFGELELRPITLPNMRLDGKALRFPSKSRLWEQAFVNFATLKGKYRRGNNSFDCVWPGGPLAALINSGHRDNPITSRSIDLAISRVGKTEWVYGQFSEPRFSSCPGKAHPLAARKEDLPDNRKFEAFVPDPPGAAKNPRLRIPPGVVEAFNALADEAKENAPEDLLLPFAPKSARRVDGKLRLDADMTVYFDIDDSGDGTPVVSAIQLTSIWRAGVRGNNGSLASLWGFFPKDRQPFNPARTKITPAEWLFGFVQDRGDDSAKRVAYAGRVRLSASTIDPYPENKTKDEDDLFCPVPLEWNEVDAPLIGNEKAERRRARLDGYVRLKELSSPKPPSPQLYFRHKDGGSGPIGKSDLSVKSHKPQGIKLYLHHDMPDADSRAILDGARSKLPLGGERDAQGKSQEEESAKRKVAVRPIKPKTEFWFHVDFDNLSRAEIALLCFSLKPWDGFHHKLGMAKPLGFGTVEIEPVAFFEVRRGERYGTDRLFDAPRYHAVHADKLAFEKFPARYAHEHAEADRATGPDDFSPAKLAKEHADWLAGQAGGSVFDALKTLGAFPRVTDETGAHPPVHTPLAIGQDHLAISGEKETFKWFVNNAKHVENSRKNKPAEPQQLPPIRSAQRLPSLTKNNQPSKGRKPF